MIFGSHLPRNFAKALCIGIVLGLFVGGLNARAEEPYQKFLQKLRDEQLFDLALIYLDDLTTQRGVSDAFKADIDVERGVLLYQSASALSPRSPARVERLDAAEATLRKFLSEKKSHPRRGEARLKLGELLLTRAEEAKANFSGEVGSEIPDAVKFYDEASKLFASTIEELAAVLKQLEGNRIDPSETEKVAFRQQLRQDVRQAQLLAAKAVEERGRSRQKDSAEQKTDLEEALAQFSDLYTKEQRMIGIRNYALFYRSGIQASLGKPDDAIDGFQRIADLEGVDVLRPLQSNAIKELMVLLVAEGKHPIAVDRAEKWLKGLRPDERNTAETIELQLELARSRISWATLLRQSDPKDRTAERLVQDTRSDLRSLTRIAGPHLDAARDLLAELGVEPSQKRSAELPKVKDFSEALAEAQKRLDTADTESIGLAVLEEKVADPNLAPEAMKEATEQLAELRESIAETREQSLQLLREGLRLFDSEDDRGQLFEARFRIAFILLRLERPLESMVVGEFLARTNPGTDQGMRAAAVTLASFSALLNEAGDDKTEVVTLLEPFAEYLVATWPQSSEASAAAGALAQLAIIGKDWEKAEKYLGLVPNSPESVSKRRDLGISLYVDYLKQRREAGEETEETKQTRDRALSWLEKATADIQLADFDSSTVDAMNAQARLLLAADRVQDASKLLLNGDRGLTKALEAKPGIAPARTAMDTYRAAIQVVAAQLVDGSVESAQAVEQMKTYVGKLQELAQGTDNGEAVLNDIFLALARDLKEKLAETKEAARKSRLSDAVLLVIGEAAKSDSFNTQYWAGSTKIEIAKELAAEPNGRAAAEKAFSEAASILESILAREKSQVGWIQPEAAKTQIKISLAQAQGGIGNHQAAVLSLGEILDKNNLLLDVQIEAAEILQAWGAQNNQIYESAIMGGRKKQGKNVIWGWGKIAQMTTNQPDFAEQFYNARLQLAKCRFLYSKGLADNNAKTNGIRQSQKDILTTASLYPYLGGEAKKKQFDALLRIIQKELGEPTKGLAVLDEKKDT